MGLKCDFACKAFEVGVVSFNDVKQFETKVNLGFRYLFSPKVCRLIGK